MVLDHAFLVLLSKCLTAQFDYMQFFDALAGLGSETRTALLHHIVDSFLETVLNCHVVQLFAQTFLQVGDFRPELFSNVTLEQLHLLG